MQEAQTIPTHLSPWNHNVRGLARIRFLSLHHNRNIPPFTFTPKHPPFHSKVYITGIALDMRQEMQYTHTHMHTYKYPGLQSVSSLPPDCSVKVFEQKHGHTLKPLSLLLFLFHLSIPLLSPPVFLPSPCPVNTRKVDPHVWFWDHQQFISLLPPLCCYLLWLRYSPFFLPFSLSFSGFSSRRCYTTLNVSLLQVVFFISLCTLHLSLFSFLSVSALCCLTSLPLCAEVRKICASAEEASHHLSRPHWQTSVRKASPNTVSKHTHTYTPRAFAVAPWCHRCTLSAPDGSWYVTSPRNEFLREKREKRRGRKQMSLP